MAKILNSVAGGGLRGHPPRRRLHALPAGFIKPVAVKPAAAVNGGDGFYYEELQDIKKYYAYLKAGGYITEPLSNFDQVAADVNQVMKSLKARFDSVDVSENMSGHEPEIEEFMVLANYVKTPPGNWWHAYKDCFKHTGLTRLALISGLYLLRKQGFLTAYDTGDYDMFQDEYFMHDQLGYDTEEETERAIKLYDEEVAFHKTRPIKLEFHEYAFHYHASRNTLLGDWLRCVWHYREFDWDALDALHLYEEEYTPISPFECRLIVYDDYDQLSQMIEQNMEYRWRENGAVDFCDHRIITCSGKVDEPVRHELFYTKAEIENISEDFCKMWQFDIRDLEYAYHISSYGGVKQKDFNTNKHYDYERRKLCAPNAAHRVRGKGRAQKGVRRKNNAKRRRTARREQPAVA